VTSRIEDDATMEISAYATTGVLPTYSSVPPPPGPMTTMTSAGVTPPARTVVDGPRVETTSAPRIEPPLSLESLAYGVDGLDAIMVVHLVDAHIHAMWIRSDAGLNASDVAPSIREAYRSISSMARRVDPLSMARAPESAPPGATDASHVLVEMASRIAILRRVRAFVIAVVLDTATPLGLCRLIARRLSAALEPELPLDGHDADREPLTSSFGRMKTQSSAPPPPKATPEEMERTRRLLAYLEAQAPEPHVVRLRLSLRAGITPVALEHPETLGSDELSRIETAVEDILGVPRAELGGLS
jgi:hypothetical protein